MNNKYTVYGDAEFDKKIDADMEQIRKAVLKVVPEEDLSALILGGGYGRGEGGVFLQNGTMELYNDYDFFVISNDLSRAKMQMYHAKLFEVGEELTEEIGIDVDFGPFRNVSDLPGMKFTMMWFELKQAHIVVYGNDNILDSIPDFQSDSIPLSEAMGLMLNRAVGLMLAKERLGKKETLATKDKDFIERNIFKAAMAAGDAFLISNHTFHHSYVRRIDLMDKFRSSSLIKNNNFFSLYKQAIMYKLKPEREDLSRETLQQQHQGVLDVYKKFFLFTAGKCWSKNLTDFKEFSEVVIRKNIDSESPVQILKNILLNLKELGIAGFSLKWLFKYPRYRLFYAVPYFTFSENSYSEAIPTALGLTANSSEKEKNERFMKLWERFN